MDCTDAVGRNRVDRDEVELSPSASGSRSGEMGILFIR
jgi:hypothetical protein